ncbi:MAG: hypothetical protein J0L93_06900 [Deltaproteobacteria bacterium]|nr:hypothetical protein [Deltaproteobacteria bacterium]
MSIKLNHFLNLVFIFLFLFICRTQFSSAQAQTPSPSELRGDVIDFRLIYPIVGLKSEGGFRKTHKNVVGLDLSYQFYIWSKIGLVINSGFWVSRVEKNARRGPLNSEFILTGLSLRPFTSNYFDPTLHGLFGIASTDAADLAVRKWNYPVGGKGFINVYKQNEVFQDLTLALAVTGGGLYYFQQLAGLEPWYFDLGLSLRGSF